MATSASGILLPATPGRSKMASSLQTLSSSSAFEDVKKTCSRFTDKFDAWVSRARQARSKRDLDFKNDLQTSQAQQRDLRAQIEQCAFKIAQLKEEREQEGSRMNAFQESVSVLAQEQDSKQTQEADLLRRANEFQNSLLKRTQALNQFKADKKTQLRKNRPELGCYEDKLAMHINSAHVDEIEFKFTHVDPNNWDRVFTFVVDVREPKVYKLTRCEPALPKVEDLLIWLNATRDFYTFLKLMRKGFMELAKSETESA